MAFFLFLLVFTFELFFDKVSCQNTSNTSLQTTRIISSTTTNIVTTKTISTTTTTQTTPQTSSSLPQLQLKIGLLGTNASQFRPVYGFGQSAPAISIAIQRARNEHLIDNVNFTFTWLICDCDQVLAVGYSNKLLLDQDVDVIIGPPCVTSALDAALPPGFYGLPIFLWGATIATLFNDNNIYPTVTNINSNTLCLAQAVEAVLLQFQWFEVSLVYIPDDIRRQVMINYKLVNGLL
uniref:ANF_receptor domain-containing protein n=1 Tax=Meloidogyne hapla TaxID=6305 RepID=A0A1I8B609_MELHA